MASVLSGWYGYNLFNIANFIEYEPYPKRRKLDNNKAGGGGYRGIEAAASGQAAAAVGDYELSHKEPGNRAGMVGSGSRSVGQVGRAGAIYRPYIDNISHIPHKHHHKHAKKDHLLKQKVVEVVEVEEEEEVEPEGGRTTIANLFPEVLCLIFEKLDLSSKGRVAQVCRGWRDTVYLKSIWKGCEARLHLRRSNPTLFPSLVRRGIRRVQVLSLRKSLRELVTGLPQLESLNLSGCYNLSDAALDTALNRDLPNLRHLNLSLCKDVTDNSLGRIATHCKNLESLDLGGCTKVTNTGLLLISWGLRRIRRLNLRSCWQVSDHGIGHLTGGIINQQSAASSGSGGARALEELCLQDCQKVTDEALRHIAEGLPSIARLNLSFCLSVTDTGLKSLARIPGLVQLNLRSCDNVSDIGIGFLGGGGGLASPLRRLDVSFCDRVTDSSMAHVGSGMADLESLSLSACPITDAGVARIAKDLGRLTVLNIGQCSRVTDAAVAALAENSRSLASIDLYGCTKVSSAGFEILAKMENLKIINRGLWHQF